MPAFAIPLRSQTLDMQIRTPALERTGTVLDALDDIVAREKSNFRETG